MSEDTREKTTVPPGSARGANQPTANAASPSDTTTADGAVEAARVLADLEQLSRERDTFKELLLRTRADFENYQKRIAKEREQERRFALWPLAVDLLLVLDNLQRALESVQEDSPLRQGVVMIHQQLQQLLRKHGIVPMVAEGQPFDPHLHQAVLQQPSRDYPPNTVLKVVEAGYYYHDRVLRPARVVVAAAATDEPGHQPQTSADAYTSPVTATSERMPEPSDY